MKKLFSEERKAGFNFVFESVEKGGVCIGYGVDRKTALEEAIKNATIELRYYEQLKEQLTVAAGKKRRVVKEMSRGKKRRVVKEMSQKLSQKRKRTAINQIVTLLDSERVKE